MGTQACIYSCATVSALVIQHCRSSWVPTGVHQCRCCCCCCCWPGAAAAAAPAVWNRVTVSCTSASHPPASLLASQHRSRCSSWCNLSMCSAKALTAACRFRQHSLLLTLNWKTTSSKTTSSKTRHLHQLEQTAPRSSPQTVLQAPSAVTCVQALQTIMLFSLK